MDKCTTQFGCVKCPRQKPTARAPLCPVGFAEYDGCLELRWVSGTNGTRLRSKCLWAKKLSQATTPIKLEHDFGRAFVSVRWIPARPKTKNKGSPREKAHPAKRVHAANAAKSAPWSISPFCKASRPNRRLRSVPMATMTRASRQPEGVRGYQDSRQRCPPPHDEPDQRNYRMAERLMHPYGTPQKQPTQD
jgi:hypothetical protein